MKDGPVRDLLSALVQSELNLAELRAKLEALIYHWPAGLGNTGARLRDNLRAVLSGEYDPRERP